MTDIDEQWRQALAGEHTLLIRGREMWRHAPHDPRCKLCYAPFAGAGGFVARRFGYAPWEKNPNLCGQCFKTLTKRGIGGAEIEITILFADVRGSTSLAEHMSPSQFSHVMHRFYSAATRALTEQEAILDKFVGDGVIGLFVPGLTGHAHAAHAIAAGRALLHGIGEGLSERAFLPVGVGIHTGLTYVGAIGGNDEVKDITALGDSVNTTARLSSVAGAGELLVSDAAAVSAGLELSGLEHRVLDLKGRSESVGAYVLTASPAHLQGAST